MSEPARQHPDTPRLSILLPAFNDAAGIQQVLASLATRGRANDIEILVSDDSTNSRCAQAIRSAVSAWANARYVRNVPPRGAVSNWNHLLAQATGHYCLLIHHDEYFENEDALVRALGLLQASPAPAGIVMPCRVQQGNGLARLHMPAWLAEYVSRRWPRYLLRRNLWGPPSVLILRRDLYADYDVRLKWLVDVDLYSRVLLQCAPRLIFMRGAGVVSAPAVTSITRTLQPHLASIHSAELALLAGANGTNTLWLQRSGLVPRLLRGLESVAWHVFRATWKAMHLLRVRQRSRHQPDHHAGAN
jgi:glycosyltransferase involved in cell wall biosynthesis